MGYVEDNLMKDEKVIYWAKLHWVIFLFPIIVAVVGLIVLTGSGTAGGIILALAVLFSVSPIISFFTSEFAATNKRIIIKTGFISRRTLELLLTKVETISVDQGILGRILDYGTIVVVGTGGTKEPFKSISNPLEFRRQVQAATSQS